MTKLLAGLVSLLLLTVVQGFWRLECDGNVALGRLDPLMSPGEASNHVHSVKGASRFGTTSTSKDLLASKCTSCGVEEDLSAYWAPAMYFEHSDGTVEVVPEKPPHKSYYLPRAGMTADGKKQTVEAFPPGFQMIAGDNFKRNSSLQDPDPNPMGPWPDSSQVQRAERALGFNCLHYNGPAPEPSLMRHHLPSKEYMDANCGDGIRLELFFPSCWNGELDSPPFHKSHVAYPDAIQAGNCPKGYDRRLVSLMYETIIATDQFKGKPGRFVLANGDPTGYAYHGDFIAAWKGNTLKDAITQCGDSLLSGDMRQCPLFTMTKDSAQCKMESPLPASIANEKVKGPMKGLANGLKIYDGPAPAPMPGAPAVGGVAAQNKKTVKKPSPKPAAAPKPSTVSADNVQRTSQPPKPSKAKIEGDGAPHEKLAVKEPVPPPAVQKQHTSTATIPHTNAGDSGGKRLANGLHILSTITKTKTSTSTYTTTPTAPPGAKPTKVVEEIMVFEEIVVVAKDEDGKAKRAASSSVEEFESFDEQLRKRDEERMTDVQKRHAHAAHHGLGHGHGHGHRHKR